MCYMHTFMMGSGKNFLSRTSISGFVGLFCQVGCLKFSDLYKAQALSRIPFGSPEELWLVEYGYMTRQSRHEYLQTTIRLLPVCLHSCVNICWKCTTFCGSITDKSLFWYPVKCRLTYETYFKKASSFVCDCSADLPILAVTAFHLLWDTND